MFVDLQSCYFHCIPFCAAITPSSINHTHTFQSGLALVTSRDRHEHQRLTGSRADTRCRTSRCRRRTRAGRCDDTGTAGAGVRTPPREPGAHLCRHKTRHWQQKRHLSFHWSVYDHVRTSYWCAAWNMGMKSKQETPGHCTLYLHNIRKQIFYLSFKMAITQTRRGLT